MPILSLDAGQSSAEVGVIGGGPAGLVSAIALAAAGVETDLIAPFAEPDHRTTALLAASVAALETLGVWQACLPHAAPLRKLRIVDDTRRLFRAPRCFSMPPRSDFPRSVTTSRTGICWLRSKRAPQSSDCRVSPLRPWR